jgi:hypothetical protein
VKPTLTCREATRLVLEGEDRRLAWGERLALRIHLLMCRACPRFVRQVQFMRSAMGRWKQYAEDDAPGTPPA